MKNRIFITIFIIICLIPTVLMFTPDNSNTNEIQSKPPALVDDKGININFLNQFSDYFDENFGLREHMISIYNKVYACVFRESAEEKVILGDDGWLFYKETLDDYQGTSPMTDHQLYSISKTLSLMQEYYESKNKDFLFTVAPNKNSIYPDKMPDYYKKCSSSSNIEQLDLSKINYVDLFDIFKNEKKVLYRKTDSHWTYEGAALASDYILKSINKDFLPFYGGETYSSECVGDLHKMIYPSLRDKDQEIYLSRENTFEYTKPLRSVEDNYIYTSCNNKSGNLFMFRDSFANTMHSILANEFNHATFCRLMPYNLTSANEADTVVVEIVERNLIWLLEKPPVFEAPQREVTDEKKYINTPISCEDSPEIDGYTKVNATFANDIQKNIYIETNDAIYEATPCANGVVAYIPSGEINENIKIFYI